MQFALVTRQLLDYTNMDCIIVTFSYFALVNEK